MKGVVIHICDDFAFQECKEACYITCNGRIASPSSKVEDGKIYHLYPRLVGGKGGRFIIFYLYLNHPFILKDLFSTTRCNLQKVRLKCQFKL